MATSPVILDLGCGTTKVPGAIGLDVVPLAGVDVVGDLSQRPYPFADNSFDSVYLNDVIEHIPNTIKTMEEVYRILKPNGRAFIRVVNWNSIYTAMDPTHLSAFTESTFDFFGKRVGRSYYSRARFDVVQIKRGYNPLARAFCPNERLLYFFSTFFSNVLEDLNFELRAVKKSDCESTPFDGSPLSMLRCPIALSQGKSGALKKWRDSWLLCDETNCKYPVSNGVATLSLSEGIRWLNVAIDALPFPPPVVELVSVEEQPIDSIAIMNEPLVPITNMQALLFQLTKTYSWMAMRFSISIFNPLPLLRRCFRLFRRIARVSARIISRFARSDKKLKFLPRTLDKAA